MKFRNRNLLKAGLSAALLSACILTAGSVHAASVQEVTAASEKALSGLTRGSFQANGELSAGFAAGEQQTVAGVSTGTELQAAYSLDPLMLELSGKGKAGVLGARFDADLHLYLSENEDGSGGVYLCFSLPDPAAGLTGMLSPESDTEAEQAPEAMTEGEGFAEAKKNWTYAQIPAEQMEAVRTAIGQMQSGEETLLPAVSNLLEGVSSLSDEMVAIDGKTCYEISVFPGAAQLEEIAAMVQEKLFPNQALNNFQKKLIMDICSILKISCVIDIDSSSCQPVRLSLDAAGTDFSSLAEYLAKILTGGRLRPDPGTGEDSGSSTFFQLAKGISAFKLEVLFDYGEDVSIAVPEEALAAREAYLENTAQSGPPVMSAGFGIGPEG